MQVGLQEARTLARGEFTREALTGRITTQLMVVGRGLIRRAPELGKATLGWLDQYQKGKLEVSVDTSSVNAPIENVSATLRQATVALLISGMIIGSAIATTAFATLQDSSWAWVITVGRVRVRGVHPVRRNRGLAPGPPELLGRPKRVRTTVATRALEAAAEPRCDATRRTESGYRAVSRRREPRTGLGSSLPRAVPV